METTVMRESLRRIGRDIKNRRHVEAYVVVAAAVVFAVLSLAGDIVPDDIRWSLLFAGLGLLVYTTTVPDRVVPSLETFLGDRSAFEEKPLHTRLRGATEVWMFAPSGVNFLAPQYCDLLRKHVLARVDGIVRVVVLDGVREAAVNLAVQQLDDSVEYPMQRFRSSLSAVMDQLDTMGEWSVAGSFAYRLLDYNPGFSLVAIDPGERHGTVIVEFHAFHNESTASRMHLELTRADSERWYAYWIDQFDHIWSAAAQPSCAAADPAHLQDPPASQDPPEPQDPPEAQCSDGGPAKRR
ncbi:MAG: hypothetical protein ACRDRX_06620 [Pseudonocardiaceae bacterium]